MNERIRLLRKSLKLTLDEFGKRLGVTKTAMSNIENGNRNITDQMFISICREYHVNESWLRNGTGEMFLLLNEDDEFSMYVGELAAKSSKDNELVAYRKEKILTLCKLPDEVLKVIIDLSKSQEKSK